MLSNQNPILLNREVTKISSAQQMFEWILESSMSLLRSSTRWSSTSATTVHKLQRKDVRPLSKGPSASSIIRELLIWGKSHHLRGGGPLSSLVGNLVALNFTQYVFPALPFSRVLSLIRQNKEMTAARDFPNKKRKKRGKTRVTGGLVFLADHLSYTERSGRNISGEWTATMDKETSTPEDRGKFFRAQQDMYGRATFGWAYRSSKCSNITRSHKTDD